MEQFVLEKLNSLSWKTKEFYTRYVELIDSVRETTGYTESHHILPKSLFPEFEKDTQNIVELTPSEHYLAHKYLALGTEVKEMMFSFHMLKTTRKENNALNDEEYNTFKERFRQVLSENAKKQAKFTKEFNSQMSQRRWNKPDSSKVQSDFMKMNNPMFSLETARKISKIKTGVSNVKIMGMNNGMNKPEVAAKFKGCLNVNYKGYFVNSKTDVKFTTVTEFTNHLVSLFPNVAVGFLKRVIRSMMGYTESFKYNGRDNPEIRSSIINIYTFVSKEKTLCQ